jgi:hypothetical protein
LETARRPAIREDDDRGEEKAGAGAHLDTIGAVALLALIASVACMATPVRVQTVRAGPFTGYVTSYDVVRRRFALRVGSYRTKSGLSQKIPWYVKTDETVGDTIVFTGVRLRPPPVRRFRQEFSTGGVFPLGQMYPSVLSPPATGCWRITVSTGDVSARMFALVRKRPR